MLDYRSKKQKANFDAKHANKPFTLSDEQLAQLLDAPSHVDETDIDCRDFDLVPSADLVPNASRKNRSGDYHSF